MSASRRGGILRHSPQSQSQSVTMWVHLNHGEAGLRSLLRWAASLGKALLVEPQPWRCYKAARKRLGKRGAGRGSGPSGAQKRAELCPDGEITTLDANHFTSRVARYYYPAVYAVVLLGGVRMRVLATDRLSGFGRRHGVGGVSEWRHCARLRLQLQYAQLVLRTQLFPLVL